MDGIEVGTRFVNAVARLDWESVGRCFAADGRLRALLPSKMIDPVGPSAIATQIAETYEGATSPQLLDSSVEPMFDRTYASWRIRVHFDEGWHTVEQHAFFAIAEDGGIQFMNMLCSGFRPEPTE